MFRKINLIALFIVFSINSYTQSIQDKKSFVDSIFKGKIEIYFKFNITSKEEINTLTKIISIDNVTKDLLVYAYANKNEFLKFLELNYDYIILPHPDNPNPEMYDIKDMKKSVGAVWNAYPTYTAYETQMNNYATTYPTLCQVYNLVTLASGRKLLIAKISHDVTQHENKPQFLYTSTMHGNETSPYIHMLHLIDTLLSGYGTNPRFTRLLDSVEIWINPLANPDGTYGASGGASITGATRENANGVDLNRNFPDAVGGAHPDGQLYQTETQTWMNFTDTMHFVMSANFHEGSEVSNYPWDAKASPLAADDSWWQYVSLEFADTCQHYGTTGYFTSPYSSGITEGYDWYQVLGGRQDFMNYYRHCREETIEVSETQSPSGSQLPTLWKETKRSFLNYMEQSLKGIRGVVTDTCTEKPLRAFISISGHDKDSSQIYSALPVGNYHRFLNTGTYNLTFSATGYHSKTLSGISISNGNVAFKNVQLRPLVTEIPVAGFTYSSIGLDYTFTNTSVNGITYLWNFGDGGTDNTQNPSHTYTSGGLTTIKLIAYNNCGSDTFKVTITDLGINETYLNKSISVYPNPVNNKCDISIKTEQNDIADISMFDLLGNKVYNSSYALNNGNNDIKIDMENYREGVYFINIKTGSGNYKTKIIKVN